MGVERYVHLRSVDDEYEHLESTLPSRARGGGAAGGVGGNPPAEGVESGPDANENNGDIDTVIPGGDSDGRSAAGEGPAEGRNNQGERAGGGFDEWSEHNSGAQIGTSRQQQHPQLERPGIVENQGQTYPTPSLPPEQRIEFPYQDDDEVFNTAKNGALPRREAARNSDPADPSFVESSPDAEKATAAQGTASRRCPSPPPSAYHYRSPSCSPRLSPRPMRSPYRQEGVGGRESSGRGGSRRISGQQGTMQEGENRRIRSAAEDALDETRQEGHAGGLARVDGEGRRSGIAGEKDDAKALEGEEKGENWGANAQASVGDGNISDTLPDSEVSGKPLGTVVDDPDRALPGGGIGDGGSLGGAELADSGGFADGYEGSVVFINSQNHEAGGGQENSRAARAEEGWWQPETGSVLRGVDFAFGRDSGPALHATGEKVGQNVSVWVLFNSLWKKFQFGISTGGASCCNQRPKQASKSLLTTLYMKSRYVVAFQTLTTSNPVQAQRMSCLTPLLSHNQRYTIDRRTFSSAVPSISPHPPLYQDLHRPQGQAATMPATTSAFPTLSTDCALAPRRPRFQNLETRRETSVTATSRLYLSATTTFSQVRTAIEIEGLALRLLFTATSGAARPPRLFHTKVARKANWPARGRRRVQETQTIRQDPMLPLECASQA